MQCYIIISALNRIQWSTSWIFYLMTNFLSWARRFKELAVPCLSINVWLNALKSCLQMTRSHNIRTINDYQIRKSFKNSQGKHEWTSTGRNHCNCCTYQLNWIVNIKRMARRKQTVDCKGGRQRSKAIHKEVWQQQN